MNPKDELTKLLTPNILSPRLYNFDEVREILKEARDYPQGVEDYPQGVSQWKLEGERFGYYDYFRQQIIEEVIEYISTQQGWGEISDIFRKHFSLKPKYEKT